MTIEQFNVAMSAIARHHSTKITINAPANGFVGNLGSTEFNIYINKCCAGCVNSLRAAGFVLSMTDNGLLVDKY